jgi:hypothetical protein
MDGGAQVNLIGNCQCLVLAQIISIMTGVDARALKKAEFLPILKDRVRTGTWLVQTSHVNPLQALCGDLPGIIKIPTVFFSGFHPDYIYVSGLSSPTGNPISAIVAAGFLAGLSVDETLSLFRHEVFERLGYYDYWQPAVAALRDDVAACGLDLDVDDSVERWREHGSFVHAPNHPKLRMMITLAEAIIRRLGLPVTNPHPSMTDPLAHLLVWPIYPEIADHLGTSGSYTFIHRRINLDLRGYVEGFFRINSNVDRSQISSKRLSLPQYRNIGDFTLGSVRFDSGELATFSKVVCDEELLDPE